MRKFTFHIVGNAHLPVCKRYMSCAFNMKHHHLVEMLMSLEHKVYCYGAKSKVSPPPSCTEFIETHTVVDIARDYGDGDNREELGYQWVNTDWRHDYNTVRKPSTLKFYANAVEGIIKRKEPDHFLLLMQGAYHTPIANAVNLFLTCEPGVGYRGSVEGRFRAFESSYIQNFSYGSEHPRECINGSYYDRVIPNYFDPEEFEFSDEKKDYYLFIGRMIKRKGIITAYLTCKELKKKLIIVGQGGIVKPNGNLTAINAPDFEIEPATWKYLGFADAELRKKLMAHAIATFAPTEYLECFAGTHIESMLSGTPPITTNFGVFPGTIPDCEDGKVGFRCNTLNDFVQAAKKAKNVNHHYIRKYGERFLMDNVKWEFQRWFEDLYDVYESTLNSNIKGWHRIRKETLGTPGERGVPEERGMPGERGIPSLKRILKS